MLHASAKAMHGKAATIGSMFVVIQRAAEVSFLGFKLHWYVIKGKHSADSSILIASHLLLEL